MLLTLFYILHVAVSFFLVSVVLLQQGKGADLSVFGGGGTQTAFGARGAATVLHKFTVISFVMFIVTTMAIGLLQERATASSVMSGVATSSPSEPEDGAAIPGAATAEEAEAGANEAEAATTAADAPADGADATPADATPAGDGGAATDGDASDGDAATGTADGGGGGSGSDR